MNKLKTNNTGGWPLELEDLEFAEAATREAFYGLMTAFGIAPQDSFIISGCESSAPNYNAGYICLNGEILKVVADVIPTPGVGEVLYWDLEISYDSAGREQFENSSTNDTYELRRGVLKAGALSVGTYMPFAAKTLADILADLAISKIQIDIAGEIKTFAMSSAPTGFLKCNGAAVSRTTYARLFTAIGVTYGVGDGVTTFNLPELRGEFIRGLDDGRGVDTGRGIGTAQADELKSHTHTVYGAGSADNSGDYAARSYSSYPINFTSAATGGSETRPRNKAMLYCIRY